jgi:hypothetical protein
MRALRRWPGDLLLTKNYRAICDHSFRGQTYTYPPAHAPTRHAHTAAPARHTAPAICQKVHGPRCDGATCNTYTHTRTYKSRRRGGIKDLSSGQRGAHARAPHTGSQSQPRYPPPQKPAGTGTATVRSHGPRAPPHHARPDATCKARALAVRRSGAGTAPSS